MQRNIWSVFSVHNFIFYNKHNIRNLFFFNVGPNSPSPYRLLIYSIWFLYVQMWMYICIYLSNMFRSQLLSISSLWCTSFVSKFNHRIVPLARLLPWFSNIFLRNLAFTSTVSITDYYVSFGSFIFHNSIFFLFSSLVYFTTEKG